MKRTAEVRHLGKWRYDEEVVDVYRGTRLLVLIVASEIGGTPRIAISLARELAARGWVVQSVVPASSTVVAEWCHVQGVPVILEPALLDLHSHRRYRDVLALCRFIIRSGPAIVNLHYGGGHIPSKDILAVRLARTRRCVVTLHHPTPAGMGGRWQMTTRLAGYLAHAIVVPSQATRQSLIRFGIPPRKIQVLPLGLPIPHSIPARAEARARLGLPLDAFVVSTLSRLEHEKGIDLLIQAAAQLSDSISALRIVVAGDGPERAALERLALPLGERILFMGRVADTADVYAAADIFVLPSYLEGFGLVYVEAAFHGVPSIGTRVGGIPEVISDEETGLLVPPGDVAALAGAIRRLHDDPLLRERLGVAAHARARAQFTDAQLADRYEVVYRD